MTHGPGATGFRLGPWVLTSKLASGGMGELFLGLRAGGGAHQTPVVVKALRAPPSEAEATVAPRLLHPNLVRTLDVGEDERRHYLALELVRGASLSTVLAEAAKAKAPLPAEVLIHIGASLCDGLSTAHAQGLLHCDVTPHNVLASAEGLVKLTDFGSARAAGATAKEVQGKLEYVSPEQLEGQPATPRSDVYSVGVTLFTLAAGTEPFRRATPQATARAIRTEAPDDLARLRPDLPPGFVAAVRKAIARKPADRSATLGELRVALGNPPPHAQRLLGDLVRALCGPELARIEEAVARAEALAPEVAALEPAPASIPPPRFSPPRGTLEVEPIKLGDRPRWLWWAVGAGALAAAALALAMWV